MTSVYARKRDSFLERLGAGPQDSLPGDIHAAYAELERFAARASAIRSDMRFTSAGHAEEIEKAIRPHLDNIARLRSGVARRLENLRSDLDSIKPTPPERGPGSVDPAELRAHLRSLPEAQRLQLALTEPEYRSAVAHAPAPLSGVSQELKDRAIAAIVSEQHGERVAFDSRNIEMLQTGLIALDEAAADVRRIAVPPNTAA